MADVPERREVVTLAVSMSAADYAEMLERSERDKRKQGGGLQGTKLQRYVAKHAVVAGAFTFLLSTFVRQGIGGVADALFLPLEKLDLDRDGQPDMAQLGRLEWHVCSGLAPIPVGKMLIEVVKSCFGAALILLIVSVLLETTTLFEKDLADDD